jgi:hypothetical protein
MTNDPYVEFYPGDLITAEGMNEMQNEIKKDIQDKIEVAKEEIREGEVATAGNAKKFGGLEPSEWEAKQDERYVMRADYQAAGHYRRYFKQADKALSGGKIEPVVIEHKLHRYPIVEVYKLAQLFTAEPTKDKDKTYDWKVVRFLVYYVSKIDPVAELLRTESSDWFYWGDRLTYWLDRFGVKPAKTQAFEDLLNDFWGHMFNPGLEQDQFKGESFGHSGHIEKWLDKSVGDLMKGGRWEDLRVAIRPQLVSPSPDPVTDDPDADLQVFHLSQNAVEIQVPQAMDLMVLLRT